MTTYAEIPTGGRFVPAGLPVRPDNYFRKEADGKCAPEGGGFVYLPKPDEPVTVVPLDEPLVWVRGRFTMDDAPRWDGWWTRARWNGWAMPAFERAAVDQIIAWNEKWVEGEPDQAVRIFWDGDVLVTDESVYAGENDDPERDGYIHRALPFLIDGTPVWEVGGGWCWYEDGEEGQ